MPGGAPLGNQNGKNGKEWQQAMRRVMARRGEGNYRRSLEQVCEAVLEAAINGDLQACKEIADREDGKPSQSVELDAASNLFSLLAGIGRATSSSSDDPPLA